MSEKEFYLKIDREFVGKTLEFKSIQEFQKWLTEERAKFQWISSIGRSFTSHLWNHIYSQFDEALNISNSAIGTMLNANQPIAPYVNSLQQWFKKTYEGKKFILSSSVEFKFIEDIKGINPERATYALGYLINHPNIHSWGVESPHMIEAALEAFFFTKGLHKNTILAERRSLLDLQKEFDSKLEYSKKTYESVNEDIIETKSNMDEYLKKVTSDFDLFFKNSEDERRTFIEKHEKELSDLKSTYDSFMSLKAPVEYWKQKRSFHREKIPFFRNWTLGVGALGGVLLIFAASDFLATEGSSVPYWKIAVLILAGTLLFWLLRVLAKLLLSHIHLESDAHEREVMAMTYLSLLRSDSGLDESDKTLILTTLFRPTSNGLINDDGVPPGIYDILTRAASR